MKKTENLTQQEVNKIEAQLLKNYSGPKNLNIAEIKRLTTKKRILDFDSFDVALMLADHIGKSIKYFETEFQQVLKEKNIKWTKLYFAETIHNYKNAQFYLYNRISKIDKRIIDAYKNEVLNKTVSLGLEHCETFAKKFDVSKKGANETIKPEEIKSAIEAINDGPSRTESTVTINVKLVMENKEVLIYRKDAKGITKKGKNIDFVKNLETLLNIFKGEISKKGEAVKVKTGEAVKPIKKETVTLKTKQDNFANGFKAMAEA
jgi:hypothetical protein